MATITVKIEVPNGATFQELEIALVRLADKLGGQVVHSDYRDEATFVIRQPSLVAVH